MAEGEKLAATFSAPRKPIYSTSFTAIDRAFDGGLREGESTLAGGFTGHAKSAFGEQIALWTSLSVPTLFLSLEMGETMTRMRMGAKLARTSLGSFRRAGLDPMIVTELNARMLDVYTPKSRKIAHLEALVRRGKHRVVVIDDCRSIDGVVMDGNGSSQAHHIAQRITAIAEENDVHVLALHQLDPRSHRMGPSEWRFQDSAIFEQRAYNSLSVYRPFIFNGDRDTVAEIRIRKNRTGPRALLHYRWVGQTMSFWEFSPEELTNLDCCKAAKSRHAT